MPFCGVWTACIVFPSHRLLAGREALRSRIRRIALTAVLKGNHTDNSVQWPSLLRLRRQHLWYCINKTMGSSPCDGPRTQAEMQEKAFSTLTAAQAMLFSDNAGQEDLCLCQAGIIIHWTTARSMLLWCHDSTFGKFWSYQCWQVKNSFSICVMSSFQELCKPVWFIALFLTLWFNASLLVHHHGPDFNIATYYMDCH